MTSIKDKAVLMPLYCYTNLLISLYNVYSTYYGAKRTVYGIVPASKVKNH